MKNASLLRLPSSLASHILSVAIIIISMCLDVGFTFRIDWRRMEKMERNMYEKRSNNESKARERRDTWKSGISEKNRSFRARLLLETFFFHSIIRTRFSFLLLLFPLPLHSAFFSGPVCCVLALTRRHKTVELSTGEAERQKKNDRTNHHARYLCASTFSSFRFRKSH